MIRSEAQARTELGEHETKFYRAVRDGIDEFRKKHLEHRADYSKRTGSSAINDYMVKHAKLEFDGVPGVEQHVGKQSFLLGLYGRWVVKFKKLDDRLRSFNIQTQMVLDFV